MHGVRSSQPLCWSRGTPDTPMLSEPYTPFIQGSDRISKHSMKKHPVNTHIYSSNTEGRNFMTGPKSNDRLPLPNFPTTRDSPPTVAAPESLSTIHPNLSESMNLYSFGTWTFCRGVIKPFRIASHRIRPKEQRQGRGRSFLSLNTGARLSHRASVRTVHLSMYSTRIG